jgi:hypothetical protein
MLQQLLQLLAQRQVPMLMLVLMHQRLDQILLS